MSLMRAVTKTVTSWKKTVLRLLQCFVVSGVKESRWPIIIVLSSVFGRRRQVGLGLRRGGCARANSCSRHIERPSH